MDIPNDDEDKLLRSVALQNATSILLARQRAEEPVGTTVAVMRRDQQVVRLEQVTCGRYCAHA